MNESAKIKKKIATLENRRSELANERETAAKVFDAAKSAAITGKAAVDSVTAAQLTINNLDELLNEIAVRLESLQIEFETAFQAETQAAAKVSIFNGCQRAAVIAEQIDEAESDFFEKCEAHNAKLSPLYAELWRLRQSFYVEARKIIPNFAAFQFRGNDEAEAVADSLFAEIEQTDAANGLKVLRSPNLFGERHGCLDTHHEHYPQQFPTSQLSRQTRFLFRAEPENEPESEPEPENEFELAEVDD